MRVRAGEAPGLSAPGGASNRGMSDPFALLESEHLQLRRLLDEIEAVRSSRAPVPTDALRALTDLLHKHTRGEQEVVYPALARFEECRGDTLAAIVEHQVITALIASMARETVGEDDWWTHFHVLRDTISQHIQEEEADLFPLARRLIGAEDTEELGRRMEELGGPAAPAPPSAAPASEGGLEPTRRGDPKRRTSARGIQSVEDRNG